MILRTDYIENEIKIGTEDIAVIEIENKKYFYRLVSDLYSISRGEKIDSIKFYDDSINEISNQSIQIINDYFNLDLEGKKVSSELQKNIISSIDEKAMQDLVSSYKKIYNSFNKVLHNIDLPLVMLQDFSPEVFIKALKVSIEKRDELLENLLLLIDINKILNLQQIIFFINLKQYLSLEELKELYKYAIYNCVPIVLIDSQTYGTTADYEKKLIIDENLDEFVL